MKKKVAIWVVAILVVALLIGGAVMFLNKDDVVIDNPNNGVESGELTNQSSGDVDSEPIKGDIDYVDPVEEYVINGLLPSENLNIYDDMQVIKLDEVAAREYFWTMTAEGLENITIDSGDTEFVSFEHGVGEIVNRLYKITGVKEGNTILRFNATYKQAPDMDAIQSETIIYKINVNAEKKVAITKEIRFIPMEAFVGHQEHE